MMLAAVYPSVCVPLVQDGDDVLNRVLARLLREPGFVGSGVGHALVTLPQFAGRKHPLARCKSGRVDSNYRVVWRRLGGGNLFITCRDDGAADIFRCLAAAEQKKTSR